MAVVTDPAGQGTSAQVGEGVGRAADALAAAGYAVGKTEPPKIAEAAEAWVNIVGADVHGIWQRLSPLASADANQFLGLFLKLSPEIDRAAQVQTYIFPRSAV